MIATSTWRALRTPFAVIDARGQGRAGARVFAVLGIACVIASCSHGSDTAPSPLSVGGNWTQGASLVDVTNNQTHIHTGSFSFALKGDAFTGSGEQSGLCHAASGDYEGPLATGIPFAITNGSQTGTAVTFKSSMCTYQGTVSSDGSRIDGTETCDYTANGVAFHWTGQWLAHRE